MKTLSARQIFKLEEIKNGGKSYWTGEQKICKYGKINKETAYRLIERVKWIGSNSRYTVEVLKLNGNKIDRIVENFYEEEEPNRGRIVGKHYTPAIILANKYIEDLKE